MIFVDSSVWIDHFRATASPAAERLDQLLGEEAVVAGDVVLAEVLQGFGSERDFRTALALFETIEIVEVGGREAAVEAARNFRLLRTKGVAVRKTIDTLIATWCIRYGVPLLTCDRDFEAFAEHLGLQLAT